MRNKQWCATMAWLFFLLILQARVAESITITAHDWQKWDRPQRLHFILGWLKAGESAADNLLIPADKIFQPDDQNGQIKYYQKVGLILTGVTVGQIIDTLTEISSDPRVATMDIVEIMPFVSGRLKRGWTKNKLDELIATTVQLNICEEREKLKRDFIEECSTLRKRINSLTE